MFDRFSQPSPIAPEGLEIFFHTPAPLPMRFLWPSSLLWSRFQDRFPLAFFAPALLKNMTNITKDSRCPKEDLSFTKMLWLIAPQYAAGRKVTELAAEIGSIMPDTKENENFGRASRLLQGTADERYIEYFKMALYRISNNLVSVDAERKLRNEWWNKSLHKKSAEWDNITEMLENSGIMSAPLRLRNITDATMNAIMEKTFQHAVRNVYFGSFKTSLETYSNSRLIDWLLQSGQNPDIRIPYSSMSPLQIAAGMTLLPLMSQLLDHGADPDYEPSGKLGERVDVGGYSHPLLETVHRYNGFDEGHLGMIERMLKMSSSVSMDSIIRTMMGKRRYFPELMEALIRNGADIFQSIKATTHDDWFIDTFSIIGCTVKCSCEPNELHPFFRLLEDAGIQNRSQIPEAVDTTSIVLLAAAEGNTAFLEALHSYGIDITATGDLGSSAIHVAAYYGHLETCKKLVLEHNALVNVSKFHTQIPSPLHFAVAGKNLDIVHLFHQSKIDVNEVFEDHYPWFWMGIIRRFETRWFDHSFTAVDVALQLPSDEISQYLLENGANAPPWGAYIFRYSRKDDAAQNLATLALRAGADPS
ncbi:Dynein heavy chain 12, axonemal [Colletotrichum siamense]|uniref:Dynein heavy chain 12, axonemal n=1 Tax=Colletotrichum siamense TaxID=690259 RepID=A0A9P5BKS9_COLSI|nr:Dynein heavy chain 12, axonemal [Colletotrichum siamense]KAF4844590.1 Dynein heavy chain 12, axonemal [Colletotrichum siamense]